MYVLRASISEYLEYMYCIAVGSTAAAMMAAEAIATGGAVASGDTVTTLQSVGVIGFGAALPVVSISLISMGGTAVTQQLPCAKHQ